MQRLLSVLKWIAGHVYLKRRNFNDDEEGKPVSGIEIGISGVF